MVNGSFGKFFSYNLTDFQKSNCEKKVLDLSSEFSQNRYCLIVYSLIVYLFLGESEMQNSLSKTLLAEQAELRYSWSVTNGT